MICGTVNILGSRLFATSHSEMGISVKIEFLIEDVSGELLIHEIMKKYNEEMPEYAIEYSALSYKGIGGFVKGKDCHNVKARQLLNDLPKRMRAIQTKHLGDDKVALFVVLDNDTRDTQIFRKELEQVAIRENIVMDHVFCIAVEEMEAWLLGDRNAIQSAYIDISDRISSKISGYRQDSICGTWEFLADMLTKGGMSQFKKKYPTAMDRGKCKSQWAKNIGKYMSIRENVSPSFRYLIEELDKRRQSQPIVDD